MEVLLKIIFIFFLLSFLGKMFFRYMLPWWLKRFMNNQQKKYNQQFYNDMQSGEKDGMGINTEGDTGNVNPDVGEYIDYEEIDDNKDNLKS